MIEESDVNAPKGEGLPPETKNIPSVKWIIFCSIFAAVIATAANLLLLAFTLFEPGPFGLYWIVPALVSSCLLSLLLTNLRSSHRYLSASVLSVALTIPISLVLLYLSVMGFLMYGLASSP